MNQYAAGQDMQYFEKYIWKNALDQLENLHEKKHHNDKKLTRIDTTYILTVLDFFFLTMQVWC